MLELLSRVHADEMSLPGVSGEAYALTPQSVGGPAFLIYYGPAYVRHACGASGDDEALASLHVLAEVNHTLLCKG